MSNNCQEICTARCCVANNCISKFEKPPVFFFYCMWYVRLSFVMDSVSVLWECFLETHKSQVTRAQLSAEKQANLAQRRDTFFFLSFSKPWYTALASSGISLEFTLLISNKPHRVFGGVCCVISEMLCMVRCFIPQLSRCFSWHHWPTGKWCHLLFLWELFALAREIKMFI